MLRMAQPVHTRWRVNAFVFLGATRKCGVRKSRSELAEREAQLCPYGLNAGRW